MWSLYPHQIPHQTTLRTGNTTLQQTLTNTYVHVNKHLSSSLFLSLAGLPVLHDKETKSNKYLLTLASSPHPNHHDSKPSTPYAQNTPTLPQLIHASAISSPLETSFLGNPLISTHTMFENFKLKGMAVKFLQSCELNLPYPVPNFPPPPSYYKQQQQHTSQPASQEEERGGGR